MSQQDLRRLVIAPVLINLVVFSLAFWAAGHYYGSFLNWLLPAWLDFLRWLLWPLFAILFVLLVFFAFTLVANLLGAPFHAVLAERLLAKADIQALPGRKAVIRSTWVSFTAELQRIGTFLLRGLPLLILFLIPGLNVAAPIIWLVFTAWYIVRDYYSYPLDALGLTFKEQEERLQGIGAVSRLLFGLTIQFALSIPLMNVFVPAASVVAASLAVIDRERNSTRRQPAETSV